MHLRRPLLGSKMMLSIKPSPWGQCGRALALFCRHGFASDETIPVTKTIPSQELPIFGEIQREIHRIYGIQDLISNFRWDLIYSSHLFIGHFSGRTNQFGCRVGIHISHTNVSNQRHRLKKCWAQKSWNKTQSDQPKLLILAYGQLLITFGKHLFVATPQASLQLRPSTRRPRRRYRRWHWHCLQGRPLASQGDLLGMGQNLLGLTDGSDGSA